MEWVLSYFILIQCVSIQADHDLILNRIIDIIQRRHLLEREPLILGVPQDPEDLPEAEPILPGHTLIQPARGMLKSSVKFPQKDFGNPVYGNLDNLGVTYGNDGYRTIYTGFRKTNYLLSNLLQAMKKGNSKPSIVLIEIDNKRPRQAGISSENYLANPDQEIEEANDASEISDERDYRRKQSRSSSKFRKREKMYSSSSSGTESSESSDYEKNPGNPYTVHKNQYQQNWLWNHVMDGDHMNINPLAPQLQNTGPSGAEIFFGRKWWYFNQDDYKPMA